MRRFFWFFALLVAGVGCSSRGVAHAEEGDTRDSVWLASLGFVHLAGDTLVDPTGSMRGVLEALARLGKQTSDGELPEVVSVVHYGDSHVQAGFLTGPVMRRMAVHYGSAGRGMVIPFKLSGSNEPRDYAISASTKALEKQLLLDRSAAGKIGVGGVAVELPVGTRYRIQIFPTDEDMGVDYRFARVVAFHDSLAPMIEAVQPVDESGDDIFRPYTTLINLYELTDTLELTTRREGVFARGPIYGFSLENNASGVLYHALGVNGACYLHWGRAVAAIAQGEALAPNLIVVSLGSNEAAGSNFVDEVFRREVDSFVSKLRATHPGVPILLTTPPEAMRRGRNGRVPNNNFERVRDVLAAYAQSEGLALFDLYGATGGAGSSLMWQSADLLAKDGIHYTVEGYRAQGALLFRAIDRAVQRAK